MALCYMCDKIGCARNISRHMARHLPKDSCYRCGRNRTGTFAQHMLYCDENKVEKGVHMRLKGEEYKVVNDGESRMEEKLEKLKEDGNQESISTGNRNKHIEGKDKFKPENLTKFVKILGRNDKRIMMALCYMCNNVLRNENLQRHMESFHLPKGTCYKCGKDRTENHKLHKETCSENKVEMEEHEMEDNVKVKKENFESSANLSKFVKILKRKDKGRILALCYMCGKVSLHSNLQKHMTLLHLPKQFCYKCGEDRGEDYKLHKETCNENKVEIEDEVEEEEGEVEGGATSPFCVDSTVEQSCDDGYQRNKQVEDSVTNDGQTGNEGEVDTPVCLTLCMEGEKKVRFLTKSNVQMVKVMRGFGRKTGIDWRSLRFTEERGKIVKEVKESDRAGESVDGIVLVERRNIT